MLSNFYGTILFVSHDRYFIDELATQVWAVEPGIAGQPASLNIVRGGYAEYIEQRRGASSATQQKAVVPAAPQRSAQSNAVAQVDEKEARRRQRRVAAIETEITKLETRLTELTRLLDEASITHNVAEVERLGREYQELEEQIAARFEEWSSLAEAIA